MIAQDKNGKYYIIESSSACYIDDVDLAMRLVEIKLDAYKAYCKREKLSSKAYGAKRYEFIDDEIGTAKKLREQMEFWLNDGDFHISKIWVNMNGVVIIESESSLINPFKFWLN